MTAMSSSGREDRKSMTGGLERRGGRSSFFDLAVPTILAAILVVAILSLVLNWAGRPKAVEFSTPYQGVLLINGAVYFGHLQGYGTATPVLTDVFYVVSRADPETKQVSNMLVKRGKELHGPDRMFVNPSQIVFVETVGATSKVAQLIAQAGG